MKPVPIAVIDADLDDPRHGEAVLALIRAYATDPLGGGADLPESACRALIPGLRAHPGAFVFLAYAGGDPVGVAVCFLGYSTFAARPLLNLHDLAVKAPYRRRGVGRRLLARVEARARELGCCKLTLEVREDNSAARRLYRQVGFSAGAPAMHFWSKDL